MRCQRGWEVKAPGSSGENDSVECRSLEILLRSLAGHLDEAAEGQQADLVVGVAVLDAEEARPKAE
jgi:hypothetical protein